MFATVGTTGRSRPECGSAHDTEAVSPAGDDVEPVLGRWTVRLSLIHI